MALTITNPTLTNPANKTQIEANFTDVVSKFSAGITTADLSSSAALTNAQLANSHYEMLMKFQVRNWNAAAPAGNELLDFHIMPDIATDGTYTITDCEYYITDKGSAGNTTVTIASGVVAAGAFTVTTTHVNAQTIASGTDDQDASGTLTIATAAIPASANNNVLRMLVVLATNALTTAGDSLTVVLKLKRTSGLRS